MPPPFNFYWRFDHRNRAAVLYVDGHADLRLKAEIFSKTPASPYDWNQWPDGFGPLWLGRRHQQYPYLY
jgi:prepilin-type processing-associated H-X9-DG protein